MYSTVVDDTPKIRIAGGKHEAIFSMDSSAMNPLEGFYAVLAGCAAVYAKKACRGLGISGAGIEISCKPFAGPGGPLALSKFKTDVRFPEHFSAEQKAIVLDSIGQCAVKKIVASGADIQFLVTEV